MEEYLYQKEYVMLNNMQLHLSNPEPMLKYIDEKVEKRDFASRSHGVVWCISKMMEKEQEEQKENKDSND